MTLSVGSRSRCGFHAHVADTMRDVGLVTCGSIVASTHVREIKNKYFLIEIYMLFNLPSKRYLFILSILLFDISKFFSLVKNGDQETILLTLY